MRYIIWVLVTTLAAVMHAPWWVTLIVFFVSGILLAMSYPEEGPYGMGNMHKVMLTLAIAVFGAIGVLIGKLLL